MTAITVDHSIISGVLLHEGWPTYTNRGADKGGPTKGGITLASWRDYKRNQALTEFDLQAVTESEARTFYLKRYVIDPHFDQVNDLDLCELLIDAAVNHGSETACKWIQAAAHVAVDGDIGPKTIAAINNGVPQALYLMVCVFRVRLYGKLTSNDPLLVAAKRAGYRLQAENTSGWCNRVADFILNAASRTEAEHGRSQP